MSSLNLTLVALFLLATLLGYSTVKPNQRWKPLLLVSILFYTFLMGFKVLIILYIALVSFFFGNLINRSKAQIVWPIVLILTPVIMSNWINATDHFNNYQLENLKLLDSAIWSSFFKVLGLSYLSFNCVSYIIDVHRGYIKNERNFFKFLLYLMFFPLVFSGPLHRYKYLSKQFSTIEITNESISRGLRLMLFGLFKMMLSQRLYYLVLRMEESKISGAYYLLVGTLFFLFLFFSFSSLIDFVQGMSQILGIMVKKNFNNRIYFSTSRQEFWRGWHITLNEWFRDYFFFPLAKKDKSRKFVDAVLLLTFLSIALWHGFTYSLLIWGLCNGVWVILEKKLMPPEKSFGTPRKVLGLIYHLTLSSLLALIFISTNFMELIKRLASKPFIPTQFLDTYGVKILIVIMVFLVADYLNYNSRGQRFDEYLNNKRAAYRWLIYFNLIFLVLIFGLDWEMNNYYIQF